MGQRGDVLAALAQGRDRERHPCEAEEQVAAEGAALDLACEIAVGRGDETNVDWSRLQRSDALYLAGFEHAEELALMGEGELADLVEERRAARRGLEEARFGDRRAGEGAAVVAEELCLDELLGQRRAVDRDERTADPRRAGVDRPGDDVLAGPRLADEEHAQRRDGDALDQVDELLHRRGSKDHPIGGRGERSVVRQLTNEHDHGAEMDRRCLRDGDAHVRQEPLVDRLCGVQGVEPGHEQARAVRAAQVLDAHRVAEVQTGVPSRDGGMVEVEVGAPAATKHDRTTRRQTMDRGSAFDDGDELDPSVRRGSTPLRYAVHSLTVEF